MNKTKFALLIGMGLSVAMFQNCSKVGYQIKDMSSIDGANDGLDVPVVPPEIVDNGDGEVVVVTPTPSPSPNPSATPVDTNQPPVASLDAVCAQIVSGKTAIVYDAIAEANSPEKNFAIQASNQNVKYEHIGRVSNGAADSVSVTARSIASVSNFAVQKVSLNAQELQCVSNFSASQVVVAAHKIESISNFSAKLCVSVHDMQSLHDLSSDLTVYGRGEGSQSLVQKISNLAGFVSLHDIDVEMISNGAFKIRVENGHIGKLSSAAGNIYLVNSSIDTVSNFAGTIHLYGNSSVKSASVGVNIIKH
jgi:hypothetical protein